MAECWINTCKELSSERVAMRSIIMLYEGRANRIRIKINKINSLLKLSNENRPSLIPNVRKDVWNHLNTSRAGGESLNLATNGLVERSEHRSGHGLDVLPEDTSGLVEGSSKLVGGEVEITITLEVCEGRGVDDVVAVGVVGTGRDGVSIPDCCRRGTENDSTTGAIATEEVITEGLVLEEAGHLTDTGLVGTAILHELENESNFGVSGQLTTNVELEFFILSLIFKETLVLEFLEGWDVNNGLGTIWTIAAQHFNVRQQLSEHGSVEVDAVADTAVGTRGGNISFESAVHGQTTSNGSVDTAWERWNLGGAETDRKHGSVGVTARHGGETDDEVGEDGFHIATLSDSHDNVLGSINTTAIKVAVVGQRVQHRARATSVIGTRWPEGMSRIWNLLRRRIRWGRRENEQPSPLVTRVAVLEVVNCSLDIIGGERREGQSA